MRDRASSKKLLYKL